MRGRANQRIPYVCAPDLVLARRILQLLRHRQKETMLGVEQYLQRDFSTALLSLQWAVCQLLLSQIANALALKAGPGHSFVNRQMQLSKHHPRACGRQSVSDILLYVLGTAMALS